MILNVLREILIYYSHMKCKYFTPEYFKTRYESTCRIQIWKKEFTEALKYTAEDINLG